MTGLREQHKLTTRRALEDAALRLFARDGYETTSVEAIAAEADVSARTFFRYFTTKDEVLTPDRADRQAELAAEVAQHTGASSLRVAAAALVAIAPAYEPERSTMLLRRRAAVTSPALRGRLHDAVHTWQHVLTRALIDAGHAPLDCAVAAEAAIAVWQGSITRWLDDDSASLADHLTASFEALRS